MESYVFKDKKKVIQKVLQNFTTELSHNNKQETFEKIQRFMPFDNFEFLHLTKLKNQLKKAQEKYVPPVIKPRFNNHNNITSGSSAEFTKP